MKYMTKTRRLQTTKKRNKAFNKNNKTTQKNSNTNFTVKDAAFTRIFQSTTFLSRSPSHSFVAPSSFNPSSKMMSYGHFQNNQSNYRVNQNSTASKNHQFKKSKSIKISNNSNKGNHFMKHHQHHYNNNNNNMNSNQHYMQMSSKPYKFNQNQNNSSNMASDIAANNLANMLHSELTINLSKTEPRMVLYNNTPYSQQQGSLNPFSNRSKFFQQPKNQKKNKKSQNHLGLSQSVGASPAVNPRYMNKFKYIKPANTRTHAPYNTTQYIMHDYSKRRANEQECPNEIQQFSDEWNLALANATANRTEPMNQIANNINKSFINTNALISLSTIDDNVVSTSLGSSLGSNISSELNIKINNNTQPTENILQLSSSL